MSVSLPKDVFLPEPAQASLARRPGLLARLGSAVAAWRERAREARELNAMGYGELQDIGITRLDVARVFDPAFAREYANRGTFR